MSMKSSAWTMIRVERPAGQRARQHSSGARISKSLSALAVAGVISLGTLSPEKIPELTSAHAQSAKDSEVAPLSCVIAGRIPITANTAVYDSPTGGAAIAKFTGAEVPVSISHFPANPAGSRVKIASSMKGAPHLRIDGWVDIKPFRFFAARDLEVVKGHVWITKTTELVLTGAGAAGFEVEHTLLGSDGQKVKGRYGCDAVSIEPGTPVQPQVPERARSYQMKNETLDIYDEPRGAVIFTLTMTEDTRQLFWSSESKNGFLKIDTKTDMVIDGWARWSDMAATRHAEVWSNNVPTPTPYPSQQLALQEPPPVVTIRSEQPIHAKPDAKSAVIGVLESGAEIYPMEATGGFTNVMPVGLGVLPPDGGGFWVASSSLPKS